MQGCGQSAGKSRNRPTRRSRWPLRDYTPSSSRPVLLVLGLISMEQHTMRRSVQAIGRSGLGNLMSGGCSYWKCCWMDWEDGHGAIARADPGHSGSWRPPSKFWRSDLSSRRKRNASLMWGVISMRRVGRHATHLRGSISSSFRRTMAISTSYERCSCLKA